MKLKHKISICVTDPSGGKTEVLKGASCTLRKRLLNLLFGEQVRLIVLTPGETVESVEIKEIG